MVAAVLPGETGLLGAARGADDGGAQRLAPLAEDGAHPARDRVDQHRLARADRVGAPAEIPRGHSLQHGRGGGLVAHAAGHGDQLVGGDHPPFGVAPQHAPVGHPVAGLEGRGVPGRRARGLDHPGRLHPEHGRKRRHRVEPAPVVGVDEVQPDRLVADEHFARTRVTQRNLLPAKHLRASEPVDAVGHGRGHVVLVEGWGTCAPGGPGGAGRAGGRRGRRPWPRGLTEVPRCAPDPPGPRAPEP